MSDHSDRLRGMTVAELKAELSKYPDDMLVLVDGYEDGWSGFTVTEAKVRWAPGAWYYGAYGDENPDTPAIVLGRD